MVNVLNFQLITNYRLCTFLQEYETFIARQKMGGMGKPEEIASLCTFLASDEVTITALLYG